MLIPGVPSSDGHFLPTLFFLQKRGLQPESLHPPRGVAVSGFRPLHNIRYCSPPWRSGQCLSPDVAGQPLSPATRQSLGEPLPHQQADRPRAPPKAPLQALVTPTCAGEPHLVLIHLSAGYPELKGRLLTCYSPVRRSHQQQITRRINVEESRSTCMS